MQPGSYGGTLEQFKTARRNRVRPLVLTYLATVPQAEIAEVSSLAARHSRKAGLGSHITRFCFVKSLGGMRGMCTAGLICAAQVRAAIAQDVRDLGIAL